MCVGVFFYGHTDGCAPFLICFLPYLCSSVAFNADENVSFYQKKKIRHAVDSTNLLNEEDNYRCFSKLDIPD